MDIFGAGVAFPETWRIFCRMEAPVSKYFRGSFYKTVFPFHLAISNNNLVLELLYRWHTLDREQDIQSRGQNDPCGKIREGICMRDDQQFHWKVYLAIHK